MESLLEKLEEECTCSICYEIFQHPKTFSCLHTFCLSCLNKLAERHRADGAVPCPKCREHIPIPSDGTFNTRTTSSLHNRLVELLTIKTNSQKNIACGNCKKETADCSFCFDCSKTYCHSCLEADIVLNTEHRVRSFKEFHIQDYQDFLQRPVLCSEKFHESQKLVFYCKQCKLCLCQLCVVINQKVHFKHDIIAIEAAEEEKKISLLADIKKLKQKQVKLRNGISEVDNIIEEINAIVDTAQAEVKQLADLLIANISKSCQASIAELETVRASKKLTANIKKSSLREQCEQVKVAVTYGETLINSRATTELLTKKEMNEHFEALLNSERDNKKEAKISTFVKFIPDNEFELVGTRIQQIGVISTGEPSDPARSCVPNESLTVIQAGGKSSFSVVTKTSEGETQYYPEDKIELTVDPGDDICDIQVTNHMDGIYELSFVPRVTGQYQAQVKLNDHNIAGSPFEINVLQRDLNRLCSYNMVMEKGLAPLGVAVSKEREIAVTYWENNRIDIFDKIGNFQRKILAHGNDKEQPESIVFNSQDELIAAECITATIKVVDKRSGQAIRTFGGEGSGEGKFDTPCGVSVDDADRVIVTDQGNNRVQVFNKAGNFLFEFGEANGEELENPIHTISYKDLFIVADTGNHVLKVFDSKGKFLYKIGERGTEDGQFNYPCGLVVDSRDNLLVCDGRNNRVQMFTIDGRFVGKTSSSMQGPTLAALLDDDKLIVTEPSGSRMSILQLT